ncbi:MAG: DegT/DnrJ/EryC1/StrS family aminotransferase [Acidobacteriota bacterium]
MILCGNPRAQYLAHRTEIDAAILRVLDGGRYILGEEVRAFEREFAAYVGVGHGIGVGSGTEALHVALTSCGIGPGDEVITVGHTAVATVAAIEMAGATPVLVDIEPEFYCMNPQAFAQAITAKTRAVLPVHLYGHPADLESIVAIAHSHGLRVIEDCSQAHGAVCAGRRVGAWGDVACFSFYPTKNLGALGDGGMVVTGNPELAERARLLREYGWKERYVSHLAGWNSRLDELQAAALRVKLSYLEGDNASRVRLAEFYTEALKGTVVTLPKTRAGTGHVYHLFVVRSEQRDRLQAFLADRGVGALVHFPVPVHLQPAYRNARHGAMTETERAANQVLSLPLYPELSVDQLQQVVEAVRAFV